MILLDEASIITAPNITFLIGIFGVVFSIYLYFKKPQISLEKQQAIQQLESANKAIVLAQQLQWEKEANEKRFNELNTRLGDANTLAMNHVHTVDVRVEALTKIVCDMDVNVSKELIRLATILEERLPSKTK